MTIKFSSDTGGSITRSIQGNSEVVEQYESDFLVLPKDAYVIDDVNDKLSTMEISMNGNEYILAKGESMNYYKQKPQVCDNNCLKADFIGTYLNIIYAMARDLLVPDEAVRVSAIIGVCLPPAEVYGEGKEKFRNTLMGIVEVKAPLINAHLTIDIDGVDIKVYPEGVVSIMSITEAKKLSEIKNSSTLLVDIGYRSTEIILLRNGVPYRGTFASAPIGGINLEALLNSMLEAKGIFLNRDDIRDILSTGIIKHSVHSVEVGAMVQAVKMQFAPILRDAIAKVLNSAGMNLSAVNYFVPIGRPFAQTGIMTTGTDGGSLVTILQNMLSITPIEIEEADLSNVLGIRKMLNRGN